jgi:hypothetical protein
MYLTKNTLSPPKEEIIRMKRFIFIIAITLVATASAYAQRPSTTTTTPNEAREAALSDPEPIRRDERLIALSRATTGKMERKHNPINMSGYIFKARLVVNNPSSKTIKSVSWVAILTDPDTGEVLGKYDITSPTTIRPGKKKKLEKKFLKPQFRVVSVSAPRTVANLNTAVTSVVFEDGTTSN